MNYEQFAYLYDHLMKDAPYDDWLTFTETKLQTYLPEGNELLDVGCGTGELLIRLTKKGYQTTGVDLSSEMLVVARDKLEANNLQVPLFEQDMRSLDGLGQFDAILTYCDSLNYLTSIEDVQVAFSSFHKSLKDKGLLILDVHSCYKMDQIFAGQLFADDEEEVSYIWKAFEGEFPHSIEHDLTFFVRNEDETYTRYEEFHQQRTYSIDEYKQCLEDAGFSVEEISADFGNKVTETSERIFFVARKK
ncbi:SAM-dependent methyltransferase [Alkalihalophilus pseudofirmus]|uniref:class I SAM-dependent DNA methyltransferase n=1 Tax=Alkalihalobacterium alkalinitrilicum TaxID=427920 RepID=UPI00094D53BA|nr:class I SAM-dependent methyltransferase [Alkalihalobacterium alkalinitrilicum]OLO38912.1 SAM-dependent methyltransferase [Alkalihalophilus pseudofirmus]